jgi:hypothetical protein
MTPEQLVETACPLVGSVGAAFYFVPETLAVGKELGLGGFQWYALGRKLLGRPASWRASARLIT